MRTLSDRPIPVSRAWRCSLALVGGLLAGLASAAPPVPAHEALAPAGPWTAATHAPPMGRAAVPPGMIRPPGQSGPPQVEAPPPAGPQQARIDIADFSVVELRGTALPNARTTSLGDRRQGGGIVIDDDGLILTIGYLVIETEGIEVVGSGGQRVPAALVGYDNNTGIGLVRAAAPLDVVPMELADSATVEVSDPVLIVGFDGVAPAYVVSRRQFAGSWEYVMEDALFTAPATTGWSGAALLNGEGRLVGVGSQLVPDALGQSRHLPGNMFVPVDALKPVLQELIDHGKRTEPARPWLGVNVQDIKGKLLVTRVLAEGPAELGGIVEGDIIVGFEGEPLQDSADFYTRLWESGDAGVEVELNVVKGAEVRAMPVRTIDRDDYLRPPATY